MLILFKLKIFFPDLEDGKQLKLPYMGKDFKNIRKDLSI